MKSLIYVALFITLANIGGHVLAGAMSTTVDNLNSQSVLAK